MVCAAPAGWLCWCRGRTACCRPTSRNLSGTFLGADVGASARSREGAAGEVSGPGGGSRARPPLGTERSCLSLLMGLCSRCFSLRGAGREGEGGGSEQRHSRSHGLGGRSRTQRGRRWEAGKGPDWIPEPEQAARSPTDSSWSVRWPPAGVGAAP